MAPVKINSARKTSRHFVLNLTNSKDRNKILKTRSIKQLIWREKLIIFTLDLSTETLRA